MDDVERHRSTLEELIERLVWRERAPVKDVVFPIVTFKSLTPEAMETIVDKFILQLESQLSDRQVAITLTPAARAWLATAGHDRVFGARPLARVIQKEVRDVLTDQILFGALEHGGTATIDLADNHLTFAYDSRQRA